MNRRVLSALLAGLLALTLAACAKPNPGDGSDVSKFDAVTFVDGLIKENYLGVFEPEYLELVGVTEEEAKATYEEALHMDVDRFLYLYDIDYPTDEYHEELEDLFKEIYTHAKYRVVSAAQQDDGSYAVKVEVESIDIVQLAESEWDKTVKDFYEKYPVTTLNAMPEREYKKVDQEWARLILNLYKSKMEEMGNQSPKSITVQLELNKDGLYTINSQDFARLDEAIIDWSSGGSNL